MTKRKLQHYFDAHPTTVVSKYLLGEVIQNTEAEGRIAKWVLELMGQNIIYAPRSAIKSQVLANFVAEWTEHHVVLSSHKYSQTSWPSGRRLKLPRRDYTSRHRTTPLSMKS
jgi:hypothetical protein